jgi:hypothetical protein
MKILIFAFSILISNVVTAQTMPTPEQLGWKEYVLGDKKLGEVHYYVSSNKSDQAKPVLLYLDGSGPYPLFQASAQGFGSTVPLDYRSLSETYHIILISKPGVPFIDSIQYDTTSGYPIYPEPKEYNERLSLYWRVNSAKLVTKDFLKRYKTDKKKIAVLGISEGFQVGAKLISEDKTFTHALLFVGNGLNQFYDELIKNRNDAQTGIVSNEESQNNIDTLFKSVKDIYAHPEATDKFWFGHTYLRWASFCSNNPTENIVSVNIPVYIVSCTNDRNTSPSSIDYMQLECIRNEKEKIKFVNYPYNHSFNEEIKNEKGEITERKNHMLEVIDAGLTWLNEVK